MRVLFALLIVALGTVIAGAQATKGGDVREFLGWCRRDQADEMYGYCLQYIARVSDQLWLLEQLQPTKPVICPSGKASYEARVEAFIHWAEKKPSRLKLPRAVGVNSAISETWTGPCKS